MSIALKTLEFGTGYTWGTSTGGTWTEVPPEDYVRGASDVDSEAQLLSTEHGNGLNIQDGLKLTRTLVLRGNTGITPPALGTKYWIKKTDYAGTVQYEGGTLGFECTAVVPTGIRQSVNGPRATKYILETEGGTVSDIIE